MKHAEIRIQMEFENPLTKEERDRVTACINEAINYRLFGEGFLPGDIDAEKWDFTITFSS